MTCSVLFDTMTFEVGVKFWTPYVFIAGPIAWFGLILAQVHPALALVCIVPFMPATHEHVQHHDRHIQQVDMIGSFIPRAKSGSNLRVDHWPTRGNEG
eukprot:g21640.t1